MLYINLSFLFFCLFVIIHIAWYRIKSEKKLEIQPILIIGGILLIVYLALLKKLSSLSLFIHENTFNFWNAPLIITSLVVYLLLIPFYMIFYISAEIESPSMKILLLVKEYGEISYEDLRGRFTDQTLLMPRVKDLISTGYVSYDGRYYSILPAGRRLVRILDIYQRCLGWRMGG